MPIAKALKNRSFRSTLHYVAGAHRESRRVFVNVGVPDEPGAIAEEMEQQARKSKYPCQRPCYHISISPHERDADSLTDKQWNRLAKDFLEDSGLGNRQAVGYLHEDEDYPKSGNLRPHLHLIANRIDDSGKAYDTSWDFYHFQSVMRELEEKHGLVQQASSWEVGRRSRNSVKQVQRLQREEREYNRGDRTNLGEKQMPHNGSSTRQQQEARSQQQGQSKDIGELLRETRQRDREERQENHQQLSGAVQGGQRQGKKIESSTGEFDGMSVIGGGIRLGASATAVAQGFKKKLDLAKEEAEGERAEQLIDRLSKVGDRAEQLENRLGFGTDREKQQTSNEPEIEGGSDPSNMESLEDEGLDAQREQQGNNPLENAINFGNARLDRLADAAGLDDEDDKQRGSFDLDPNASTDEQFDRLSEAIDAMDDRLDALEQRAEYLEELAIHSSDMEEKVAMDDRIEQSDSGWQPEEQSYIFGKAIAQSLNNYASARSEVYATRKDEDIPTRSLGTISPDPGSNRVSISDDEYGLKFEAQQNEDGNWQVTTNELNEDEKSSIASLPQTKEDYQVQASGKSVVYGLSNLAPEDMKRDRDSYVRWKGENDRFDYSFSIGGADESSKQQIMGYDNQSGSDDPVFEASIDEKGFVRTDRCDIPSNQLDRLVEQGKQQGQQGKGRKPQKQRQRSKQHSKNMEL